MTSKRLYKDKTLTNLAVSYFGQIWVVLMSVIGAFYYLRVIKVMYFDSVREEIEVDAPADMQLMVSTNAIAILALGIFPGSLMALCVSIFL